MSRAALRQARREAKKESLRLLGPLLLLYRAQHRMSADTVEHYWHMAQEVLEGTTHDDLGVPRCRVLLGMEWSEPMTFWNGVGRPPRTRPQRKGHPAPPLHGRAGKVHDGCV